MDLYAPRRETFTLLCGVASLAPAGHHRIALTGPWSCKIPRASLGAVVVLCMFVCVCVWHCVCVWAGVGE